MRLITSLFLRLRALFARQRVDAELNEEIRFHLDHETERLVNQGVPREEAQRRARVAFGGIERVREEHRDAFGVRWMHDLVGDARYAFRTLRRTPVLAVTAILTIAIGIGANTAIFSAVEGVVLRPLPFPQANRLMMLWESNPEYHWWQQEAAPANVLDWKARVPAFQDVAMYVGGTSSFTYLGGGEPQLVQVAAVTGNFFDVLGVRAAMGRVLRADETWSDSHGTRDVYVVSHRFWANQLHADSAAVGRSININGRPSAVVGVLPAGFDFISPDIDIWRPVNWDPVVRAQVRFRRAHFVRAIARLKPGVSVEQASAQLQAVIHSLQSEYPETNRVMGGGLTPLHDFLVRDTRRPLTMLLLAVALLLLIACANVGNLLLVRALARGREVSMRQALGAGRGRLVRQALTESLVLSVLGGTAGVMIGWVGTHVLVAMQPPGLLPTASVHMSWAVLAYVAGITVASGVLFGIAPALWNGRRMPAGALKDGGDGSGTGARVRRVGHALVVGEVALALLLSVGAGLLVRSFWKLTQVSPGFEANGVLALRLNLPTLKYDSAGKVLAFYDALQQRVRALPGATGSGLVDELPLTNWGWTSQFHAQGWPEDKYGAEVAHRSASSGYFGTMHVPILRGRNLGVQDRLGAPRSVLINASLAQQYFKGENPIGRQVAFDKAPDSASTWYTIVGVVGDERQTSLGTETKIQFTTAFAQDPSNAMWVVVHTAGSPAALAPSVRRIVRELDSTLAIAQLTTMTDVRARSLATQRFFMTMLVLFAAAGLVLAVVGVYGVLAQLERARRREVGIRVALGASLARVRWFIVARGLRLVSTGLAVGVLTALFLLRGMRSLLYAVTPGDVPTFLVVSVVLLIAATAAAWIPAVRAGRTDPARTLRGD